MKTDASEKADLVSHVAQLNEKFQQIFIVDGCKSMGRYLPKSGVSLSNYSEILDFLIFRTYDCGHSVALFNQLSLYDSLLCQPVVIPGKNSHVISRCVKGDNVLFIDPLFSHLYIYPGGDPISESDLPENWAESVQSAISGIHAYPIDQIQYRNPKLILNRMIDWLDVVIEGDFRTFSFRTLFTSQHEFFFKCFTVIVIALILIYRAIL